MKSSSGGKIWKYMENIMVWLELSTGETIGIVINELRNIIDGKCVVRAKSVECI